MMHAGMCVCICVRVCIFAEEAERLWSVMVTELYRHYHHYLSSGYEFKFFFFFSRLQNV